MINKLKEHFLLFYKLIRDSVIEYQNDRVPRLGAALAYYTIFSLPAVIIIIIAIVGSVVGSAAVEGQVYENLRTFLSEDVARQVQNAVKSVSEPSANRWAAKFGAIVLFFGATGVFYSLQDSLNSIYDVYVDNRRHFLQNLINRIVSFGMILCLGFLLLVSLIINSLLVVIRNFVLSNQEWLKQKLDEGFDFVNPLLDWFTGNFLLFLNFGVSLLFVALFFALIYKILPDASIKWRFIIRGAFFSSFLFWVGKSILEVYLANARLATAYGAAGSLVAIMLWVYFSAQLLFFGAEYIKVLSLHHGVPITRRAYAFKILDSKPVKLLETRILRLFKKKKKKELE
jgi:membrane protein